MLSSRGKDGLSLEEVLRGEGVAEPAAAVAGLAVEAASLLEYLEVHIEQVGGGVCGCVGVGCDR